MFQIYNTYEGYIRFSRSREEGINNRTGNRSFKIEQIANDFELKNTFVEMSYLFHLCVTSRQKIKYDAGHVSEIGVRLSLHDRDTVSRGISSDSVSYSITLTVPGITTGVTSPASANLTAKMNSKSRASQNTSSNQNIDFIKVPKTMKGVRVLGLIAVISYMIVILFAWIYTSLGGYEYFLAGETNTFVKYTEWALGFTGIFVAIGLLREEINGMVGL